MAAIQGPLGTAGGAAAAAFVPTSISGLVLWLKADSLGLSDGTGVSSWTDSSGSGNTASQGTGGNQPLYKTNIINSMPVVRFDGVDDFLTVTRNAGLEPNAVTIIMLFYKASGAPANSTYLFAKKHTAGAHSSYAIQHGTGTGNRPLCRVATTGNVNGNATVTADDYNSYPHIMVGKIDGSNLIHIHDGVTVGTSPVASGNIAYDTNDLKIGSYDGTTLFAAYDLGELLLYNTALSSANLRSVASYLVGRWWYP